MNIYSDILILLLSGIFSSILIYLLLPKLRLYCLDNPNNRSSHENPTPSGGGLAFISAYLLMLPFIGGLKVLYLLPMALVGFVDDIKVVPRWFRYLIQLTTSYFLIKTSNLYSDDLLRSGIFVFFEYITIIITSTAIINFINFMDGVDGLVAGCMCLVIATFSISSGMNLWPIIGGLLGFLWWNWHPAKIFMGDIGSTFLGGLLVFISLQSKSYFEAISIVLIALPMLADACICVLRRLFAGQNIFKAHKLHLYQRLYQAGWSHSQVSSLYISGSLFMGVTYILFDLKSVMITGLIELIIGFWLDRTKANQFDLLSS